MKDFLLDNRSFIINSIEILAAIIGLIYYKKYKSVAVKYFAFFLVYVVVIEYLGSYPRYFYDIKSLNFLREFLKGTLFARNYWWYTLFWKIGAILFFAFYYIKVLKNKKNVLVLKYSLYLFLLVSVIYIIITWPLVFKSSLPVVNILGAIIILECVFFYLLEILTSDRILKFYRSITFYISLGVLFFWLIKTPLVFYEVYFTSYDENYVELKGLINVFIIVFMYLTFAIGLIVSKPEELSNKNFN